jgi:hypothetical protein
VSCNRSLIEEPFLVDTSYERFFRKCSIDNEASKLGNCLAHFAPFVDELVVIADGVDDRVVAIAQEYGARFYDK